MTNGSVGGLNIGDLFCFASAVFFSLWMIYLGEFLRDSGNAAQLTLAQFFLTGAICLAAGMAFEDLSLDGLQRAAPELLLLGVFSTGVAYLLQSIAQKNTSAGEAAIITSGEAVFGAIGAFLLIGERFTFLGAAGAALVLSGILILQLPLRAARSQRRRYTFGREASGFRPDAFPAISNVPDFQTLPETITAFPATTLTKRRKSRMKNYSEFKGYLTRIEYDRDSGSFVARKVGENGPLAETEASQISDAKAVEMPKVRDVPLRQKRHVQA